MRLAAFLVMMLAVAARAERIAFQVVPALSIGEYHPSSTKGGSAPQSALSLRLVDVTPPPGRFCRLEYGLTATTWGSPFETVTTIEGEALLYYAPTPVLPFEHELFYGLGAGASRVERGGATLTSKPMGSLSGGIAIPVGDWSIETRVKLIMGTHDELFDVSGTAVWLTASTTLEVAP